MRSDPTFIGFYLALADAATGGADQRRSLLRLVAGRLRAGAITPEEGAWLADMLEGIAESRRADTVPGSVRGWRGRGRPANTSRDVELAQRVETLREFGLSSAAACRHVADEAFTCAENVERIHRATRAALEDVAGDLDPPAGEGLDAAGAAPIAARCLV